MSIVNVNIYNCCGAVACFEFYFANALFLFIFINNQTLSTVANIKDCKYLNTYFYNTYYLINYIRKNYIKMITKTVHKGKYFISFKRGFDESKKHLTITVDKLFNTDTLVSTD